MCKKLKVDVGLPLPLGVYEYNGGINFTVFSRHAKRVWVELFDEPHGSAASTAIELDPRKHPKGDI